jgi:hypothetical protein
MTEHAGAMQRLTAWLIYSVIDTCTRDCRAVGLEGA